MMRGALCLVAVAAALQAAVSDAQDERSGRIVMPGYGASDRFIERQRRPYRVYSALDAANQPPTSHRRPEQLPRPAVSVITFPGEYRTDSPPSTDEEPVDTTDNSIDSYEYEYEEDTMDMPDDMDMDKMDVASLIKISKMSTAEDFANMMGVAMPENLREDSEFSPTISARFGSSEIIKNPVQAECAPSNVTVDLDLPKERGATYFPTCVRLPRCGGCCLGEMLSCQPSTVKTLTIQVMKVTEMAMAPLRYGRSVRNKRRSRRRGRRAASSYYYVDQVAHVDCGCACKVQAQHCDPIKQIYDEENCACNCMNKDEEVKCQNMIVTHKWDKESCSCKCKDEEACSTGQYFSDRSCSCVNAIFRPFMTGTGPEGLFRIRNSFINDFDGDNSI